MATIMHAPRRLLWGLIRAYQLLLSPLLGGACRYSPSCSAYAAEAVLRFGALKGGWLAAKRVARCHPFGGWGYDPVPAAEAGAADRPRRDAPADCPHGC